jgi:RHS repeat-associated protein
VTDEAGETVWTSEYTPFGDPYLAEGDWPMLRSSLVRMDEDTGLYYFNARWYDADIGRFVEEDPIQSEWLGYFNEKSRGRTEQGVKAILEEEANAEGEGKKVELASEPQNLDEIESNSWYSSENRAERGRKFDNIDEAANTGDTDQKFENENGVNWYWFCSNNPVCFVDSLGLFKKKTFCYGLLELGGGVKAIGTGLSKTASEVQAPSGAMNVVEGIVGIALGVADLIGACFDYDPVAKNLPSWFYMAPPYVDSGDKKTK